MVSHVMNRLVFAITGIAVSNIRILAKCTILGANAEHKGAQMVRASTEYVSR